MFRNCLAYFGLLFLTLVILVGVASIAWYYDSIGLVDLPVDQLAGAVQIRRSLATPVITTIDEHMVSVATAEWTNPLDLLPTATWTPVPTPTDTPVPPMDASVYRAETIGRLKALAAALQRWLELNNRLAGDNNLKDDPSWQSEVSLVLQDIQNNGHALGEIGPPPPEYEAIDGWLNRISAEVDGLKASYQQGLISEDPAQFLKAGEHFTRIKETLAHAVEGMLAQNWVIE